MIKAVWPQNNYSLLVSSISKWVIYIALCLGSVTIFFSLQLFNVWAKSAIFSILCDSLYIDLPGFINFILYPFQYY